MAEKSYAKSLVIYYCGSEECHSGHAFGPALRTQYLLHYVVSGMGVYQVGGKSFPVKAGEGFLIKPSEITFYFADEQDPWTYMWVAFDGYEAAEILDACSIEYIMKASKPEEFEKKMKNLIEVFGTQNYNEFECLSLFYGMMSQLLIPRGKPAESISKEYFDKASVYIYNNYSYSITIGDIAKYVGIDRTYLYKIFLMNQSLSPKQFLLNIRITAAKNMMQENNYSVSEIALSSGFKDSSSFCNHFKRLTGKTPKQFKAEIIANNTLGPSK